MKSIYLTGHSGFVGVNLIKYLSSTNKFIKHRKGDEFDIGQDFVIHLAGETHDLIETTNPKIYYQVNTKLTKELFDAFLASEAKVFITLSSVKAVVDRGEVFLTEEHVPNPLSHYGKSKLQADEYVLSKEIPEQKRIYILRPCIIHGKGNKGNLNLLYRLISKGIPWPLGAYENKRSFCSIENLLFIFKELIDRDDIPSGVYNIADDLPLSTNDVISILAESQNRMPRIWKIPKGLIEFIAKVGSALKLPLNEERLRKLTGSYIVSNKKIVNAIGKPLPVSSREGLSKTFKSFEK